MKNFCIGVTLCFTCMALGVFLSDCTEHPKQPSNLAVEYSAPQVVQRIRHTTYDNTAMFTDSLMVTDLRMVNGKHALALYTRGTPPLFYEAQDWQGLHLYQHPLPELSFFLPLACTERWVRYSTNNSNESSWVNIDTTVLGAACRINENNYTIDARITTYTARNSNNEHTLPVACTEYIRVTTINGTLRSVTGSKPVQWIITRKIFCNYEHGIVQAIQVPTVLDAGALGKLTIAGIKTTVQFYMPHGKSLATER